MKYRVLWKSSEEPPTEIVADSFRDAGHESMWIEFVSLDAKEQVVARVKAADVKAILQVDDPASAGNA
jgi:hypothetical protein